MSEKLKKSIKILALGLIILVIGGIGGVFMNSYVIPKMGSGEKFSQWGFVQRANENVTIINRTEQIIVGEDESINRVASQASTAVVNILSFSEKDSLIKNGTGLIVTADGYIVTYSTAVIEKEAEYMIFTSDDSSYEAELIGIDEYSNLAFMKVEASNLPVIAFADSNDFRPGGKVIAIGNSFGEYQNRYSAGILSHLNKVFNLAGMTVSSSEKMEGVFEVDFSNQEDYVGGPIISYRGELVGITGSLEKDNKKKFFQIPSDVVRDVMSRAIEGDLEERANLGLYYLPITASYAIANGLEERRGALVYSTSGSQGLAVISGSVAQKAGIKVGDIILAIDDKQVDMNRPLSNLVSEFKKGDEAILKIKRGGGELDIEVKF